MTRRAVATGLLLLCVGLFTGCPKPPGVELSSPAAVSPKAAEPAAPPSAAPPGPRTEEIPVTRPVPPVEIPVSPMPPSTSPAPAGPATGAPSSALKDIFFDFNDSVIRNDQVQALNENAAWLKTNSRVKITIEGHADQRGTSEYNLALGVRRAKAVKDYFVAAGIQPTRIVTISYGEERPFVVGYDESVWRWNRRAHFVVAPR